MKIITVTGFKGGVGKSTAAIHLAAFFSEHGQALLVDGDPNHTALAWAKEGKLSFEVVTTNQVARAVQGRDWIIFDTPARPNSDDLSELVSGCDLLILPTTPDIVSIRPMIATIQALGQATYRTLISIVPPRPMKDGDLAQKELQELGFPIFNTMIRRSVVFTKAASAGVVVRDLDDPRAAAAWEDYCALGREVMGILK
jgi:chromosome partitioning protein